MSTAKIIRIAGGYMLTAVLFAFSMAIFQGLPIRPVGAFFTLAASALIFVHTQEEVES